MLPRENNHTTLFAKLQQTRALDLRDSRGKRHDLAIVLTDDFIEETCAGVLNREPARLLRAQPRTRNPKLRVKTIILKNKESEISVVRERFKENGLETV